MIGSKPFRRIGVLIAAVALCVALGPTASADEVGTQSARPNQAPQGVVWSQAPQGAVWNQAPQGAVWG